MNRQQSAKEVFDQGWKRGHTIYIDGQKYPSRHLKDLTGSFVFDREEELNAVTKILYYSTQSVQQKLL